MRLTLLLNAGHRQVNQKWFGSMQNSQYRKGSSYLSTQANETLED